MLPPLARVGRLLSSSSSLRTLRPRVPYAVSGSSDLPPLLVPLCARPSPYRASEGGPGGRESSGARRGMSLCTHAVDVGNEASSCSAVAAASDLSAPYLSVRIRCRKQDAELLSEALLCFGAFSTTVDDIADSGNIYITSIYADGEDVDSSVSNAASSAGLDYRPVYETSVGKQCDWVSTVQETYEPTEVADGLWVVPNWETPPDPLATNIIINPGLAFGMGEHPTTKLCLLLLREVIKGGEHVMDYGTGTGVLGIAALKMGAALSTGIDIDPQAITATSENLLLNGLSSDQMPVYLVPSNLQPFPINISKSEGKGNKLGNNFDLQSSRGGTVAVSGILEEQVPKVEEVYSRYLDNMLVSGMDGWACLKGTRRV